MSTQRRDNFFDGSRPAAAAKGLRLADPAAPPDPMQGMADQPAGDPLLQALSWLTRHHGAARSPESLRAGAPVEGAIAPDQAMRIMREAGYNAGILRKGIDEINPLLLPAVLLLKGGDACVLVKRLDDDGSTGQYQVVFPGPEAAACTASVAELEPEYTGFVMVVTQVQQSQATNRNPHEASLLQPGEAHWLWSTLKRFVPYYRSAMMAALLSNVLMLVSGLVTSVIYDKVIPHQAMVTLWTLAIGAALALAFDLFSRQLRAHLIDLAGRKVDLIVGAKLFRQTLGVRMEHKPASAGSYAHYLSQVEIVRDFFTSATMSALTDVPFIVIFVAMTFVVGGPLGWVLVLAIPLILAISMAIQGQLRRAMRENMAEMADLHGTLVEAIEGLEDLKTSGAQGRFLRRYEHSTALAAESGLRSRTYSSWGMNLAMTLQQLINLVMLVVGVYLIQDGQISAGSLLGAVMFAGRATMPLSSVVGLATRYHGARAAMQSLDMLMSKPTEREAGRTYITGHQVTGQVGLRDVSFAYPPTGDTVPPSVLKNVTVNVAPGERIAVLGRIGSGKSTILRLMAGLYQPGSGMVEVDGLDLRQIDPADYRQRVGFVSQEPRLFKGTMRENVMMGRSGLDARHLNEVARLTGLDRVVGAHPQGWELSVGEMGGLLSGGQRQLVALARCLITKPQILLMDEPTSSMDAQSEVMFLRHLQQAAGARTLIMVTHRPAVLELVDRIMVVDNGRLVMDGPKAAVLAALSGVRPQPNGMPQAAPAQAQAPAAMPDPGRTAAAA